MKKLILSVAALTFTAVLFAQKTAADVAKFTSETVDLGKIKQGNPTTATFTVMNIGKEPLIIEQANPTCGCTVGDYTKSPIAPGKTGTITATYNAAALNHFDKHLTVKFAGVDEVKSITITGDVLAVEDYDKWALENDTKKKTDAAVTTTKTTKTETSVSSIKAAKNTDATSTGTKTTKTAKSTKPALTKSSNN